MREDRKNAACETDRVEDLPNSRRVRGNCPELLEGLNAFYERIWLSDKVDASVKD